MLRVVSLVPSLTAALQDLGAGDRIVGRTKWCPAFEGEDAATVGGTKTPDVPAIRALEPDVVLAVREENPREAVVALREAGVTVTVFEPRRVVEAPGLAWALGRLVGKPREGEAMATRLAEGIRAATRRAAERTPRVAAYLVWREPWLVAGPRTWIGDMLKTCGMRPIDLPGEDRYPATDPRALVAAGAELVLLSSEPFRFREEHREEFREAAGIGPGAGPPVRLCRGDLVGWYPSRTLEGLRHLEEILEDLDPES
jgi:ABC-type hemin transport system substrate-binding protein